MLMCFVRLQTYDFAGKAQRVMACGVERCDVCDTAKVRFFKQVQTHFLFTKQLP